MRLFDPDSDAMSIVMRRLRRRPASRPRPGPPGRAGELPPGPPLEVPHNLQRIRTAITPPLQPQDQAAHIHGESRSCLVVPSLLHAHLLHAAKLKSEADVAACGSEAMQVLRSTCYL